MNEYLSQADGVLRGIPGTGRQDLRKLLGVAIAAGIIYGGVMGTFGNMAGDRSLQVLYSGVKIPLLLLVSFALSLPSFFILNTLLGLRDDFPAVLKSLVSSQAGLTVVLCSLSPFTLLWYASFAGYQDALRFNMLMFTVASAGGQFILRRAYRPLIARDDRHRWLLRAWIVVYAFVGIQMGWVLRPFVGSPGEPVAFFRHGNFANAYQVAGAALWGMVHLGH